MKDFAARLVRRDGWTPDRRAVFIAALGTGSVAAAAAAAGMSRQSAYRLRARGDAEVLAAWGSPPPDAAAMAAHGERLYGVIAAAGAALSARIAAAEAADSGVFGRWLTREIDDLQKRRFASTSVTFARRAAAAERAAGS